MWDIYVLISSIYLIIIRFAEAIYFKIRSYYLFMKFGTAAHRYYNYYIVRAGPINRYIPKNKL